MGILLSRFRKKGSPLEVLEKLDNEIREIEENKSNAQTKQKKIAKILYLYSLGMCLVCCIIFYYQYSSLLKDNLLYLVPLALSPIVLLLINKIISWYYVKLIKKSQSKLIEMKKEKKRILDEVMDKETYKVAKEILDKYSNDTPKQNQELRKRIVPASSSSNGQSQQLQVGKSPPYPLQQNKSPMLMSPTGSKTSITSRVQPVQGAPGPRLRLPAPILPLQRSYMDKVFEYLIGDGPNNRFALICSRCHSHNGMALKEEFEYISFKCCYCFFYNPARKIRPEAPKLEDLTFSQTESNDSASDSDSKAPMMDNVKASSERENHTSTVEKNKNSEAINTESTNPLEEGNNDSEKENDSINEPDIGESKPLNEPPQKETIANVN